MNGIVEDITFTTESYADLEDSTLPTLDFALGVEKLLDEESDRFTPRISHSFYEKSITIRYIILENSAMSWEMKQESLAQETIRWLSNTSQKLGLEIRLSTLEEFIRKLKNSGYNAAKVQEIILSGLRGFRARQVKVKEHLEEDIRTQKIKIMCMENIYPS